MSLLQASIDIFQLIQHAIEEEEEEEGAGGGGGGEEKMETAVSCGLAGEGGPDA